jgi:hypothetical protein
MSRRAYHCPAASCRPTTRPCDLDRGHAGTVIQRLQMKLLDCVGAPCFLLPAPKRPRCINATDIGDVHNAQYHSCSGGHSASRPRLDGLVRRVGVCARRRQDKVRGLCAEGSAVTRWFFFGGRRCVGSAREDAWMVFLAWMGGNGEFG